MIKRVVEADKTFGLQFLKPGYSQNFFLSRYDFICVGLTLKPSFH